ncbi:MAG: hypothetical protein JW828_03130, partial [Sedimentisphaerales bacterium]|nr:hypothetical protein [Sedimentisphaerales bacterium]
FGSGVNANVEAMARIGWLYCRQGQWEGGPLIPASFVAQVSKTPQQSNGLPVLFPDQYSDASNHYGLLWWNNNDGTFKEVPNEAFWSWGLYDSIILVIPDLDLVVARTGDSGVSWKRKPNAHHYEVLKPFFEPIVQAVPATSGAEKVKSPCPPSPVIREIVWAPKETIIRKAQGGDNWPTTWGDDDALYTAYGDGWGFEPKAEKKLSLGLAKVLGGPQEFQGINIRSASGEQIGQGPAGKKASGMLMVDGILYMIARNAAHSQLAWSTDHAQTWTWSDWRFTEGMGCPTFLNFGKNYTGARDEYVYLYSHDGDSAYVSADRMILARVLKDEIRERRVYEWYAGMQDGGPVWERDISLRKPVFIHPGRCYRSSVAYHPGISRYLWWQVLPGDAGPGHDKHDTRWEGGFGIYDAPEPWGPWTTAFYTEQWDVGPGESASIPTSWIHEEDNTFYLVFSGQDCFSVRKGWIVLNKYQQ